MRVLWVVNNLFPAVTNKLGLPASVYGGWMYGLAEEVQNRGEIELHVVTATKGLFIETFQSKGINYHILKAKKDNTKYDRSLEPQWAELVDRLAPEVVHIHGTEFAHGLALMKIRPKLNYLVSIQGLVSVCKRYYYAGISKSDILKYSTLRDWLRWDTLIHGKQKYARRGVNEKEYIKRTQAVMGRTDWDFAHCKTINPNVDYYFGNETLRKEFYNGAQWTEDRIGSHTIFLSQASVPVKGLHQVIKAVALLQKQFPNISIRIAGSNILDRSTVKKRIKFNGFANYIHHLAKDLGILDRLVFTGSLSAVEMREEYLNCSIFICPSSIENSPNSLGEAQLLGVPVIASYVGGIPNMVEDGKTGLLYRFEEYEMLAQCIVKLLNDSKVAKKLGEGGKMAAMKRHDGKNNVEQLLRSYHLLSSQKI